MSAHLERAAGFSIEARDQLQDFEIRTNITRVSLLFLGTFNIIMKLSLAITAALVTGSSAFAPTFVGKSTTALNLFGSGKKKEGDGAAGAGPMAGMAQQMELFKKAQEIAGKKKSIDAEVAKLDIIGKSENEKVTSTVKIIPGSNPMSPAPDFAVSSIDFDDEYFESASVEDLSAAVVESVRAGEKEAIEAMNEKYAVLANDLQGMMAAPPQE